MGPPTQARRASMDGVLAAGGAITGLVTAEGTFQGLRGVEVCSYWDEEPDYCAESESNGTYEITGLHGGPHLVEFWAPELASIHR